MKKKFLLLIILSIPLLSLTYLGIKITLHDFAPSLGDWKGELTYLDYKSGKPYSLPVNLSLNLSNSNINQLIFTYTYPNEPKANGKDTLELKKEGTYLNEQRVTSVIRAIQANIIQTERSGTDGNEHKKAIIREVYELGKNFFVMRKEVKFEGELNWIKRNEFVFKR